MEHKRRRSNWLIHECGMPSFDGVTFRMCPKSEPITTGSRVTAEDGLRHGVGTVRNIRKVKGAHVSRTLALVEWDAVQGGDRLIHEFAIDLVIAH